MLYKYMNSFYFCNMVFVIKNHSKEKRETQQPPFKSINQTLL